MRRIRYICRRIKYAHIKMTILTLFCCLFFIRGYVPFEKTGDNLFHVFVNNIQVGTVGDREEIEKLLITARKNVASKSEKLLFMDVNMSVTAEEVLWGNIDEDAKVISNMEKVLEGSIQETMRRAYTLKVNEYMVNLASAEDVLTLLQTALDKYDSDGKFAVELTHDEHRGFNVLSTQIVSVAEQKALEEKTLEDYKDAGVQNFFAQLGETEIEKEEQGFEDFDYGLLSMSYAQEVEIIEAYLPENQLTDLETAINEVTKEQEMPSEYQVVAGDTLSEISLKVNIPVDKLIEMNGELLKDANTTIHIGDKLLITIPEPELSIEHVERQYIEEVYEEDIIYIDVDDWYTTKTEIIQQPSSGFRKIVADVSYLDDKEISREIVKEEVVKEAVAKIVKRGTKIPPSFIKPISGGRASSGFGPRSAPTKGASTYHKGQDWAVPTGTSVYASCGGTVVKAGWGSGYGYVVYIDHEDGRQTRYAHLSKVLVKVGQKVKQGEKIALSGNTGITSGPHLHFELLINGRQVNPLKYINK